MISKNKKLEAVINKSFNKTKVINTVNKGNQTRMETTSLRKTVLKRSMRVRKLMTEK